MKDAFSLVLAVIFLVILIIILPLYNFFERQDDMSYNIVLKSVTMFVDEVSENGYIDQNMYNRFIERLATTGNTYDIEIEAQKRAIATNYDFELDESYEPNETYIEQYKSYYNKDIFNDGTTQTSNIVQRDNSLVNGVFFFDVGDKINVRVKNTNITMSSALLGMLTQDLSREKINIFYGSTIKNNNWESATISQLFQSDILITLDLVNPNPPEEKNGYPLYNFESTLDRVIKFRVKVLNADDTNIASKITENIRLVGTNPSSYISPSSISSGTDEGEYIVEFSLSQEKAETYFRDNAFNVFYCMMPANAIQGNFSKNVSVSSDKIVITRYAGVEVPEL